MGELLDRRLDLVETIETLWSHDLNVASSAGALGLHVNTVHHRLARVAELSGLDPRRLDDLAELVLAHRLMTRGPASSP